MTSIGKVCSAVGLDQSGEINIVGYKNEAEKFFSNAKVRMHAQGFRFMHFSFAYFGWLNYFRSTAATN